MFIDNIVAGEHIGSHPIFTFRQQLIENTTFERIKLNHKVGAKVVAFCNFEGQIPLNISKID
jgi:hypothetical protein